MSWGAERRRRAAVATATMKMDVKLQETVKARTVSACKYVPYSSGDTPSIMLSAPLLVMIYCRCCNANELQQQTHSFLLMRLCSRAVIVFPNIEVSRGKVVPFCKLLWLTCVWLLQNKIFFFCHFTNESTLHSAFPHFLSIWMLLHLLSLVAVWEPEGFKASVIFNRYHLNSFFPPISIGINVIHVSDCGSWRGELYWKKIPHSDTREPDRLHEGRSADKILACVSQAPSASPGEFLQRCRNAWCSFSSLPTALTQSGANACTGF